ncbi:HAD-IIB family hydrolase [Pseudooceanicola onchidii]|uniref:HAD-IIB family hydrolase n=1 Tax=Pseudooceanicola onchidii TaxID=2562279 RepID=UPI0010AA143F|nr:HAD-IIB family hydrolase [Pseudooceanicola onchidii]
MQKPPLIVFTDLDGTLLDHHDYSWQAAAPALDRLKAHGIPLVIASSKTAAEIAPLRAELGFAHCPAIVENGAGFLAGDSNPTDDTGSYPRLRAALDTLPAPLRKAFRGFGDMSDAEVASITGLSRKAARLAQTRAFSEPGLFEGDEPALQAFVEALSAQGIKARRGGRFLTLSFGGTKADRMADIGAEYGAPYSIALGDAPNDVEMLEAADHGVVIANPAGPPLLPLPSEAAGGISRSEKPGPSGWNDSILRLLSDKGLT